MDKLTKWKKIAPLLVILGCALLSQGAVYQGQFFGEDETLQLEYTSRLIDAIHTLDPVLFLRTMATPVHPPLRFLLAIPGVLIFPHSEFGTRIGAILFSLYMTYLVYALGKDLGGTRVGFISGLLIAISPVYNWTSMAFGWSVIVTALLLGVRLLRNHTLDLATAEGRKACIQVNLLVIAAFLTNTGCVLFFVSTGLVYLIYNLRRFWQVVKAFVPFVAFYALYYFVNFVAVPYIAETYFNVTTPFGQLSQNAARAGMSYLNITSLMENLQGINGYFLPYVAWIVLACAIYYLVRHEWTIALWLSVYAVGWSFILTGGSHQYFLLVFIVMVPFCVKFIHDRVGLRALYGGTVILVLLMALWNYQIFLKPYGSDDPQYPHALIKAGNVTLGRVHNISEPYEQIGADIDRLLTGNDTFIHDVSGSFTMFYYPSTRYAGQFGSAAYPYDYDQSGDCYRVEEDYEDVAIIVTIRELCDTSAMHAAQTLYTYDNSMLQLFHINP